MFTLDKGGWLRDRGITSCYIVLHCVTLCYMSPVRGHDSVTRGTRICPHLTPVMTNYLQEPLVTVFTIFLLSSLQAKYEALVLNDIPLPSRVKVIIDYRSTIMLMNTVITVQVNNSIINHPEEFTSKELEDVTTVFKSLETGLRQGTIFPKVDKLH